MLEENGASVKQAVIFVKMLRDISLSSFGRDVFIIIISFIV